MQLHTGHCINISNKFHGDSRLLAFAAAQLPGLEDLPRVTWSLDTVQCVSLPSIVPNSLSPWKLPGDNTDNRPAPTKVPSSRLPASYPWWCPGGHGTLRLWMSKVSPWESGHGKCICLGGTLMRVHLLWHLLHISTVCLSWPYAATKPGLLKTECPRLIAIGVF